MISNFKSFFFNFFKIENLFLIWLILLPFGSKLVSFSIGFMTIYPGLILTLILGIFSIKSMKNWNKFAWIFSVFLLVWLIYAISFVALNGINQMAIFDVRSLFMQLMYFIVFLNCFCLIKRDIFFRILKQGISCYFFILLFFGIFEFFNGIHFAGDTTAKLVNLPISNIFDAPLFLYDNANDYLLYLIFIYLLKVILTKELQENLYQRLFYLVIILIFTLYADSKLCKFLVISLISMEVVKYFISKKGLFKKNMPYLFSLFILGAIFFNSQIFYGPRYKNGINYRINGMHFIEKENSEYRVIDVKKKLNKKEQEEVINFLNWRENTNPNKSTGIRENLILNGTDFIKEKPILGIGPGNFRKRHDENKVKNYTGTVNSAHNFPLEIISQYGVFAWIYFAFLIWIFYQFLYLKFKKKNKSLDYIILFVLCIPVFWLIPSSYLYLDLNWMLIPLLFIFLHTKGNLSSDINDKILY